MENSMTNQHGHILVVDDNRMNRIKLSAGLEQQGHTVTLAEHGKQALEMMRNVVIKVGKEKLLVAEQIR
jgi:CheY-like chemotaxis protein